MWCGWWQWHVTIDKGDHEGEVDGWVADDKDDQTVVMVDDWWLEKTKINVHNTCRLRDEDEPEGMKIRHKM